MTILNEALKEPEETTWRVGGWASKLLQADLGLISTSGVPSLGTREGKQDKTSCLNPVNPQTNPQYKKHAYIRDDPVWRPRGYYVKLK